MAKTSTKKHLSVTIYYLLIAIALGWPALAATGWLLPLWRLENTLNPLSLATIHILVLGAMMTVAFGVLYQIVPIAFQAPPVARHVVFWHLPWHVLSVLLMVGGFLLSNATFVTVGGISVLIATCLYFSFVIHSYRQARNPTAVHQSLTIPFVALFLVMLIGIYQAFGKHVNTSVLMSHVLIGGLAFWCGLVIVISYKLIPMFVLSHGYKASLSRTVSLYFPGVALFVITAWLPPIAFTPVYMAVTILVLYGLISFSVDVVAIVRARKRKRIVLPLYNALFATAVIVLSQVWLLAIFWTPHKSGLILPVYLLTFGGLLPLMFAYMQKIVPFLWFEYRFSKRPERKAAPLIDDMVPKRTAQFGMFVYYVGVLLGMVFLVFGGNRANTFAISSAICLTLGSFILFLALQHVLTIGGRRPENENG